MTDRTIVLGSRGSALALWQTNYIASILKRAVPQYTYRIEVIKTMGDKIHDVALSRIGGKGLFTKELERALLEGRVDLCVHSMKDMPTVLPEGLCIAGVPERACPLDVLVAPDQGTTIDSLPAGSRVATGSLRRAAQLRRLRPDIETCEIRGNVDTRIKRVMSGEFDAAVMAAAGIERLGMNEAIASHIPAKTMIPAAGQGVIALETRADDDSARSLCQAITDTKTLRDVSAERFILAALEGGCQVPMGVYAYETSDDMVEIDSFVSAIDGSNFLRAQGSGSIATIQSIAEQVRDDLVAQGAREVLAQARGDVQ
ncbi:MAG: hydroxymethylbilane synthase [Eggerthellaceae bacterium]|jgi:hydroxymethylbilane synthase|nr:hydroxymethylbilane synthase [Eggerthellaceae bacterium]MCH4220404.1 hydroxymethylbilane synthase [Eggerthellaceae bacterium]